MRTGSSPLTRGGLFPYQGNSPFGGLIPAYAGRTISPTRPGICSKAHPRLRGADSRSCSGVRVRTGSSPLTRGGPICVWELPSFSGLIPAYAGRTTTEL
ncbi:hypothetical protein HMPREF0308_0797 [Corynebacterium striatum ATCC 6940]|nr:hypothetical protein HMPREF0308_0797 [Corynebacterium striatum ATCC 6940]